MVKDIARRGWHARLLAGASVVVASAAFSAPAAAYDFSVGDVDVSVYTTLSAGVQVATQGRKWSSITAGNNGNRDPIPNDYNVDDGQLNFDKWDPISAPLQADVAVNIRYGDYGFFTRGIAFYDAVLDRNELSGANQYRAPGHPLRPFDGRLRPRAHDAARSNAEVLDWYAYATFYPGNQPLNIRVGNQVITWGEALFTQNAINIVNPLDLQKFNVPGAEIRDGLIPVQSVFASYEIMEGLTIEGFYAWDFESLRYPAVGTYFAWGVDAYAPGSVGDNGVGFDADCYLPENPGGGQPGALPCIRTTWERDDGMEGDWGLALRYFSPELNNSDMAFYFARYTDRLGGFGLQTNNIVYSAPGVIDGAATFAGVTTFREFYPKTTLYGFSFNTLVEQVGTSLAGEVSFKKDAPAFVDNGNVWFANMLDAINFPLGLAPVDPNANPVNSATPGEVYSIGRQIDTWNTNLRATKILGQSDPFVSMIGSDGLTVIVEASAIWADIPEAGVLPFGPAGTYSTCGVSVNCNERWGSSFSWGYNVLVSGSYPYAVGPVTLNPSIAFSHGVQGITPVWGGWQEKVKAMNLSLQGQYLTNLTATLNYSFSWDGGYHNNNRDFAGFTVNYQF